MNKKEENFKRISSLRVNNIINEIRKLEKLFTNIQYYEYTENQAKELFNLIQDELDKQKEILNNQI